MSNYSDHSSSMHGSTRDYRQKYFCRYEVKIFIENMDKQR